MANLIGMPRAAWRRQPQGPVELDRKNTLSNNLFFLFHYGMRSNYDVVSRQLLGITNTTFSANVKGIIATQTDRNLLSGFQPIELSAGQGFTLCCAANPVASGTRMSLICQRPSGLLDDVQLRANSDATGSAGSGGLWAIRTDRGGDTATNYCYAANAVNGAMNFYAFVCNALVFNLYINGVIATASSSVISSDAIAKSNLCIGGLSDSTAIPYAGSRFFDAAWGRSLSAVELKSIYENPWQLFKPRIARFILIPSSGPVTFKPYWARSRSLIIGSGV